MSVEMMLRWITRDKKAAGELPSSRVKKIYETENPEKKEVNGDTSLELGEIKEAHKKLMKDYENLEKSKDGLTKKNKVLKDELKELKASITAVQEANKYEESTKE